MSAIQTAHAILRDYISDENKIQTLTTFLVAWDRDLNDLVMCNSLVNRRVVRDRRFAFERFALNFGIYLPQRAEIVARYFEAMSDGYMLKRFCVVER